MPQGEGTYGSKVGRPKKEKMKKIAKTIGKANKTNLKGTNADKIISPTVKGLKKSGKAIKKIAKTIGKKANKALQENKDVIGAVAAGAMYGYVRGKDARGRSEKKRGPK
tara:strand:- start:52 stop:378 length:327 start_codon:yes stop_codon:yes gene_type:complete